MIGSVRTRLTIAVMVVVGALAVTAALVAPRSVRNALVDDRLDGELAIDRSALGDEPTIISASGDAIGPAELAALFGPELADDVATLEGSGVLERLRSFRSDGRLIVTPARGVAAEIEGDGSIRVERRATADGDGPIVTGARLELLAASLGRRSVFDSPLDLLSDDTSFEEFLDGFDIESVLDGRFDLDALDDSALLSDPFLRDLFENIRDDVLTELPEIPRPAEIPTSPERDIDQFVFGTRALDGVDVIVAAPSDGIDLSVERVQAALWAAVPLSMLLTGLVTWLLAGRALRPVRAITRQTGLIRAGTLHERVPVPNAHDEVAELANVMNDMLDRLEREDRRRRQFVADASHELRSPLAAIQTQAELAARESNEQAVTELAQDVLSEVRRLDTIVGDLLSLARHDEELAPPGGVIDFDDVVLAEATRSRRVPVVTNGVSAGRVRGRRDELTSVVAHLLDNATRHARKRVEVALRTDVTGTVTLDVDDDGPGIDPADRERIFDRFERLDDARVRDAGGAGLGLAVVASVVRAGGGDVTASTSPLGGARLSVKMPAAE